MLAASLSGRFRASDPNLFLNPEVRALPQFAKFPQIDSNGNRELHGSDGHADF